MASRNIYHQNKKYREGFSVIEIVVTLGVLIIITSFGMTIDLNSLRGDTFFAEESKIVSALERARSHAMANLFESAYGVCFTTSNYIIFRETDGSCVVGTGSNEIIPADINMTITFPTIIFNRLTGNTTGTSIHITDGIKEANITVNNEGTINW